MSFDVLIPCCAGFDVHKETVVVCVRRVTPEGKTQTQVRTYRTETGHLSVLVHWLTSEGVTHVTMESTGVFWKPIYNILEEQGKFEVLLVNARDVKQVRGRKTDVKDCEWLAQLLQHGLLKPSFIPPRPMREMRDLTRHRAKLTDQQTAIANRIHKVLQDANIKLSSVASDVLGVSGRKMIESLIAGETDPKLLADLAQKQLRSKIPELEKALEGRVLEHHRFQLDMLYGHLKYLETLIGKLDVRIAALMSKASEPVPPKPEDAGPLFAKPTDPKEGASNGAAPEATGSNGAEASPLPFDEAVQLLMTIPGIKQRTAENILAEIGTDMRQFPSDRHLASWVGIAPGNNESAGKRLSGRTKKGNRWARRALSQAGWAAAHTKETYFASAYGRWAGRRGKKRAVVALGHSLLTTVYMMLKTKKPFAELGPHYLDRRNPEQMARHYVKRLEALGFKATLEKAA
jgi:transposase